MTQAGQGEVLVVGSVNVDFVVRVRRLPRPGETVTGGEFTRHHGGKGANQAVAASRLGARVVFIGAVGNDEMGRSARADLEAESVDARGLVTRPDPATGVALIVVDADGENQIAVASGANAVLDGALVRAAMDGLELSPHAVLLANLEISDDALMAAAREAHDRGMRLVINPAPARDLPADLLAMAPLLLPNEGEARQLTGEQDVEAAARALSESTGAPVVVTLGRAGALFVEGSALSRVAPPPVEAVDTTGAGDTFAGAFAAELAAGGRFEQALRLAVVAASLSVTQQGARGGMPTRDQLSAATEVPSEG